MLAFGGSYFKWLLKSEMLLGKLHTRRNIKRESIEKCKTPVAKENISQNIQFSVPSSGSWRVKGSSDCLVCPWPRNFKNLGFFSVCIWKHWRIQLYVKHPTPFYAFYWLLLQCWWLATEYSCSGGQCMTFSVTWQSLSKLLLSKTLLCPAGGFQKTHSLSSLHFCISVNATEGNSHNG